MLTSTRFLLRVSNSSNIHKLAGAIAHVIRSDGAVDVQAIGAGAVNQTVKAIAVAHSFLEPEGMHLSTLPQMVKLNENGMHRTAIRFAVQNGLQNGHDR